jgi:hypothetical protein
MPIKHLSNLHASVKIEQPSPHHHLLVLILTFFFMTTRNVLTSQHDKRQTKHLNANHLVTWEIYCLSKGRLECIYDFLTQSSSHCLTMTKRVFWGLLLLLSHYLIKLLYLHHHPYSQSIKTIGHKQMRAWWGHNFLVMILDLFISYLMSKNTDNGALSSHFPNNNNFYFQRLAFCVCIILTSSPKQGHISSWDPSWEMVGKKPSKLNQG